MTPAPPLGTMIHTRAKKKTPTQSNLRRRCENQTEIACSPSAAELPRVVGLIGRPTVALVHVRNATFLPEVLCVGEANRANARRNRLFQECGWYLTDERMHSM